MPVCPVCRRDSRGFGWFKRGTPIVKRAYLWACSKKCQDIITMRFGKMIDPTENEITAMLHASDMAGEYLEHLGKTDMSEFSEEEWMTLIEVIVGNFSDKLRDIAAETIPF